MLDDTKTVTTEGAAASPPIMSPLAKVQCISQSNDKERLRNMKWCMAESQGIRRIQGMPKPMDSTHLAIIGGGPTLNDTYKKISRFKYSMSCGSSHDHVVGLGINPTYHIECDPHLSQINMYNRVPKGTKYLISSRCHRSMFKKLKGRDVYLWHMWEADLTKKPYKGEEAFICGATCVLAAIPVAIYLKFKHFHFFGFDSSFPDKENHHAYKQPETAQMLTVKVGDPVEGKEFLTTATWAGQAQQFEDMQNHWGMHFDVKIYGDSMQAEMQRYRQLEMVKKGAIAP